MSRTERKHPREEDCSECGSPFYCEGYPCDETCPRCLELLFEEKRERRRRRRQRRGSWREEMDES